MTLHNLTRSSAFLAAAALVCSCVSSGPSGDAGPTTDASTGPTTDTSAGPTTDASTGPTTDTSAGPTTGADGGMSQCRAPVGRAGCTPIAQIATPVNEIQVASAPPRTTAGWYPAGTYALTSATVYTGPGGASGPSGIRYAVTLQVNGMGSTDYFQINWTQPGCPNATYTFSGDTFNTDTALRTVTWMCPACPTCGNTMPYTGTLTSLILYLPMANGNTLAQEFTLRPMDGRMMGCGMMGPPGCGMMGSPDGGMTGPPGCGMMGQPCCGTMCTPGYTCVAGHCAPGGAPDGGGPGCGMMGQPCCGAMCTPGYTCVAGYCHF